MAKKVLRRTFLSMGEVIDRAKKSADRHNGTSTETGRQDWFQTSSFDEACELALNGWDGARADMSKLVEEVSSSVLSVDTSSWEPVWDVAGQVPDVEAYMMGSPDCMMTFEETTRQEARQVVRILVNASVSGGFSGKDMLTRGTGICGLVEVLMTLGYATEVWIEAPAGGYHNSPVKVLDYLVKLKGTEDYVDLDQIAFALGHPSWLRRIVFALMEGESQAIRQGFQANRRGGYGSVERLQCAIELEADIMVEGALLGRDGSRDAEGWIRDALRQIGVGEEKGEEG